MEAHPLLIVADYSVVLGAILCLLPPDKFDPFSIEASHFVQVYNKVMGRLIGRLIIDSVLACGSLMQYSHNCSLKRSGLEVLCRLVVLAAQVDFADVIVVNKYSSL